ncbi:MAG: lipid A biosynthesis lauroyl acyltransferase [Burkholderiaceae bacterium]|nr:lipid A biosynthesis lauroyl acyltransferase [Burkholderiaceae bacterium]
MNNTIQKALIAGLLRALSWLPYGLVARLGSMLGAALYRIPSRRKQILLTNLRLCFPDMPPDERDAMGRDTFRHVIRSYLERGIQWYGSAARLSALVELDSAIPLQDNYDQPTIFMGFHFAAIEAGCMYYSIKHPVASLYSPMSDVATDSIALKQRSRFGTEMIPRHSSARQILKTLKSGKPIMLAADMDFGLRDSVFVPFFGVQACTLTAVSRLAQLGRARVVPFVTTVLPNYRGYKLSILKPLENYPSGDLHADALHMNQLLETEILKIPEQYYWVHRRFKRRPEGHPPIY